MDVAVQEGQKVQAGEKLAVIEAMKMENILFASQDGVVRKISAGKGAQISEEFMIIARCESLITGAGMEDALARAQAYVEAGADGIMIHSKATTPDELFAFCGAYAKLPRRVPLVAVPSTYSGVSEEELMKHGVNIVIYANHLLRSAYPAMQKTAESILTHGRALEAEAFCMPIREVLGLI